MAQTHAQALDFLLKLYDLPSGNVRKPQSFDDVMRQAEEVSDFLAEDVDTSGELIVTLIVDPPTRQDGHPASAPLRKKGHIMQIRDNEQFDATLQAKDAKGYDVQGDAFTATVDDGSVVSVNQSGDTFTVVAGAPGSAVVTFTDGTISATLAVDVVAGDVATVSITEGPVTPQAAAPTA